jgi:hypothetical protein
LDDDAEDCVVQHDVPEHEKDQGGEPRSVSLAHHDDAGPMPQELADTAHMVSVSDDVPPGVPEHVETPSLEQPSLGRKAELANNPAANVAPAAEQQESEAALAKAEGERTLGGEETSTPEAGAEEKGATSPADIERLKLAEARTISNNAPVVRICAAQGTQLSESVGEFYVAPQEDAGAVPPPSRGEVELAADPIDGVSMRMKNLALATPVGESTMGEEKPPNPEVEVHEDSEMEHDECKHDGAHQPGVDEHEPTDHTAGQKRKSDDAPGETSPEKRGRTPTSNASRQPASSSAGSARSNGSAGSTGSAGRNRGRGGGQQGNHHWRQPHQRWNDWSKARGGGGGGGGGGWRR